VIVYFFQKKLEKACTKSKIERIFVFYSERRFKIVLDNIPATGTIVDKQRERINTSA
jgi:hypothetical protein